MSKEINFQIPDGQMHEIPAVGGWKFHIIGQDGAPLKLPQNIKELQANHPGLGASIIYEEGKWKIREGLDIKNSEKSTLGVSIHGQSQLGRSLIAVTEVRGEKVMSLVDQKRDTMGKSSVLAVMRGFITPGLSSEESALLELKEEGGQVRNKLEVLGYPYNNDFRLFVSSEGGGTSCFAFRIPSRLLEEIKQMTDKEKEVVIRRYRLNEKKLEDIELGRGLEGIKGSYFFHIEEIGKQRIWDGNAGCMYTIVSFAREMLADSSSSIDFSDCWKNLPPEKREFRGRDKCLVTTLSSERNENLIGGKPAWQVSINGDRVGPIGFMRARSRDGVMEVVYGERHEAQAFDGFVVADPAALLVPLLVVDGKAYIGGRFISHPNVGEKEFFSTTVIIKTRLTKSYEDKLLGEFESLANVNASEVLSDVKRSGCPINPNSAHMTEAVNLHFANVRPKSVVQKNGHYYFEQGDENFVFVPIEYVINNTPDGMAAAAASIVLGAGKIKGV